MLKTFGIKRMKNVSTICLLVICLSQSTYKTSYDRVAVLLQQSQQKGGAFERMVRIPGIIGIEMLKKKSNENAI